MNIIYPCFINEPQSSIICQKNNSSTQITNQNFTNPSSGSSNTESHSDGRIEQRINSKNPTKNNGHWTELEHRSYLEFLLENEPLMNQCQKKSKKMFKQMSDFIATRSPSQCRSHHQKFNPFQAAKTRKIFEYSQGFFDKMRTESQKTFQQFDNRDQIITREVQIQIKPVEPKREEFDNCIELFLNHSLPCQQREYNEYSH